MATFFVTLDSDERPDRIQSNAIRSPTVSVNQKNMLNRMIKA